jgi:hypothetical protein
MIGFACVMWCDENNKKSFRPLSFESKARENPFLYPSTGKVNEDTLFFEDVCVNGFCLGDEIDHSELTKNPLFDSLNTRIDDLDRSITHYNYGKSIIEVLAGKFYSFYLCDNSITLTHFPDMRIGNKIDKNSLLHFSESIEIEKYNQVIIPCYSKRLRLYIDPFLSLTIKDNVIVSIDFNNRDY